MKINYPKAVQLSDGKVYVTFYHLGRRYRLYNGSKFGINLNPNSFPLKLRMSKAHLLASEIYDQLLLGNGPESNNHQVKLSDDRFYIQKAIQEKIKENLSKKHLTMLKYSGQLLLSSIVNGNLSIDGVNEILTKYENRATFNTMKRYFILIIRKAEDLGMKRKEINLLYKSKGVSSLKKPIKDLNGLLTDLYAFNKNLHLCCLLTYLCLLRPHREIRELKWGDFSDDLSFISLDGSRNKSRRNRVVPLSPVLKKYLIVGEDNQNIFSGQRKPYNSDYFKTLWSRFKTIHGDKYSEYSIYSFRHTGALNVYHNTDSLEKVKVVMGHKSITTTLGYLKGLEHCTLQIDDMPSL